MIHFIKLSEPCAALNADADGAELSELVLAGDAKAVIQNRDLGLGDLPGLLDVSRLGQARKGLR